MSSNRCSVPTQQIRGALRKGLCARPLQPPRKSLACFRKSSQKERASRLPLALCRGALVHGRNEAEQLQREHVHVHEVGTALVAVQITEKAPNRIGHLRNLDAARKVLGETQRRGHALLTILVLVLVVSFVFARELYERVCARKRSQSASCIVLT